MIRGEDITTKSNVIHLAAYRMQQSELKILKAEWCGVSPDSAVGTLYTIQIGSNASNIRLAYQQGFYQRCAWVKEKTEEEARSLMTGNLADHMHLFDPQENDGKTISNLRAAIQQYQSEENKKNGFYDFDENQHYTVLKSEWCGNAFDGIEGTIYTIQVGDNPNNVRLAYQQDFSDNCAWIKKGAEAEVSTLKKNDLAEHIHLFDLQENDIATVARLKVVLENYQAEQNRPKGCYQTHSNPVKKALG